MKGADFFAGYGTATLAMRELGIEVVYSCEQDKYCRKTYKANHGHEPQGIDITSIDPVQLPGFDLLVAGPPCQAFSVAGRCEALGDSRGNLFFEIFRIMDEKRPSVVVVENVKNLLYIQQGEVFRSILEWMEKLGYDAEWQVLNSINFGVPQNRERLYLVGYLRGLPWQLIFPIQERTTSNRQTHSENLEEQSKFFPQTTCCACLKATNWKLQGDMQYILEPEGIRTLTVRESARLQGLPDTFSFPVSRSQATKMIGNAMTLPVIKAVLEEVLRNLNKSLRSQKCS